MTDLIITQPEADTLLYNIEKYKVDDKAYVYPMFGGSLIIPLLSLDNKYEFTLDLWRGTMILAKGRYQTRTRKTIILARLDFGGSPHRNPDQVEMGTPHIHLYREGFGDKWAFPLPPEINDSSDRWQMLDEFMNFCKIVSKPNITRGLFV